MKWSEVRDCAKEARKGRNAISPAMAESEPGAMRQQKTEPSVELVPLLAYPVIWQKLTNARRELDDVLAHLKALGLDPVSWRDDPE
jgi:hypothetical protein